MTELTTCDNTLVEWPLISVVVPIYNGEAAGLFHSKKLQKMP